VVHDAVRDDDAKAPPFHPVAFASRRSSRIRSESPARSTFICARASMLTARSIAQTFTSRLRRQISIGMSAVPVPTSSTLPPVPDTARRSAQKRALTSVWSMES
jgi:hypothetical protein